MIRAISYDRISTKDQASGDGLRRQEEAARAYCKEKGAYLDEGFRLKDVGVSAFRGKNARNGALGELLQAASNGRVGKDWWLIVENLDRLSRMPLDEALMLFRQLLSHGLEIHCLMPRMVFTQKSLSNLGELLPALFSMSRAHEESAVKSERLKAVWSNRRRRMSEGRVNKLCPKWLRPSADGRSFEQITAAVAAVRLIYRYAIDGLGTIQIAERLNRDKVPPIGNGASWDRSYVVKILHWRAVLGEHQPCTRHDRRAVPEGEPIRGYYPAIISEKIWYAAQHAIGLRKKGGGRRGNEVANLFTGLLRCARDGERMNMKSPHEPGQNTQLISSGAVSGKAGSSWLGFPYKSFESYFLMLLTDKQVPDLLTEDTGKKASQIADVMGQLADIDHSIQMTRERIRQRGNSPSLLGVLEEEDERKAKLSAELDRLRGEQATAATETLGEARSLYRILQTCPPEQRHELRSRLKARLRGLIREIWVLVEGHKKQKAARVQVFFRNAGHVLCFNATHPLKRSGDFYEDGPDGTRTVSTTCYSVNISAGVCRETHLLPEHDLRKWRERASLPDRGGEDGERPQSYHTIIFVPTIISPDLEQLNAALRQLRGGLNTLLPT